MAFSKAEPVEVYIIVDEKVSEQVDTINIWDVNYLTEIMKV
jgi:hypothetical protein